MTTIDAAFPVKPGATIPSDHGYPLYSAVSAVLPELHEAAWLGIHSLGGLRQGDELTLTERSRLRLRLPAERIPVILPLAGGVISVAGQRVQLGAPQIYPLETRASLDARLVLIRLTRPELPVGNAVDSEFAARFVAEAQRQLDTLGVRGQLALRGKQRLKVGEQRLLGFSVRVDGLDAASSLLLQVNGLGGKRRMGCGIFRPTRERSVVRTDAAQDGGVGR